MWPLYFEKRSMQSFLEVITYIQSRILSATRQIIYLCMKTFFPFSTGNMTPVIAGIHKRISHCEEVKGHGRTHQIFQVTAVIQTVICPGSQQGQFFTCKL